MHRVNSMSSSGDMALPAVRWAGGEAASLSFNGSQATADQPSNPAVIDFKLSIWVISLHRYLFNTITSNRAAFFA